MKVERSNFILVPNSALSTNSQAAYVIYFNYFAKFEFLLLCV